MRRSAGLLWAVFSMSCVSAPRPAEAGPAPLKLPGVAWPADRQALHLLNRCAYGPSPADRERLARMGPAGWLQGQLSPGRDEALEAQLAQRYPSLALSVGEAYRRYPPLKELAKELGVDRKQLATDEGKAELRAKVVEAMGAPQQQPRQVLVELTAAHLTRAIASQRQLEEVLVDFWFNHFNVSAEKGQAKWMVSAYERDAIRPFVFGRFADLLRATAHHPAMLFYLDNWMSVRNGLTLPKGQRRAELGFGGKGTNELGLNENYARELLELHTLGVDAGYTQADVREAARALTGFSLVAREQQPNHGEFIFRPFAHDDGEKNIFGLHLAGGGGQSDGERLLDYLASHPATARHLALKLCQKFVADQPPPALVDRVAAEFLRTGGDLRATYLALFTSGEFWSDQAYAAKTKTPQEFAVSLVRAVGQLDDSGEALLPMARALEALGQPLYRAQPPTGYAETASQWVSAGALVTRINLGMRLAANRVPGLSVPLQAPVSKDPGAVIDQMALLVLGERPSAATRKVLKKALQPSDDQAVADGETRPLDARFVAGLLMGSPEFQKQ